MTQMFDTCDKLLTFLATNDDIPDDVRLAMLDAVRRVLATHEVVAFDRQKCYIVTFQSHEEAAAYAAGDPGLAYYPVERQTWAP